MKWNGNFIRVIKILIIIVDKFYRMFNIVFDIVVALWKMYEV